MREEEGRMVAELRRAGRLTTDAEIERALRLAFRYGRATRPKPLATIMLTLLLAILIGGPLLLGLALMTGR